MSCIRKISRAFTSPCKPLQGGVIQGLVINPDDIDAIVFNDNPAFDGNVLTSIALKVGTQAYLIESLKNASISFQDNGVEGTFFNRPETAGIIRVFETSPEALAQINKMLNGKFVFIFESNGYFRVIGLDGGAQIQSITSDTDNEDLGGGYEIAILASEEASLAKHLAVYSGTPVATYDYAASKAAFESLLEVVPTP